MQGDNQGEAVQAEAPDAQMWLRATVRTLERQIDAQGNEVAQRVPREEGGEAMVDIIEDLTATFRELSDAIDRGEGAQAVRAVRDTLRQVEPLKAAQIADMMPPNSDGTRHGLAFQIGQKRAQLAHQDREIRRGPAAFLDHEGGDLWDAKESAESLTGPRESARRNTRRDLDALVHAWDVLR